MGLSEELLQLRSLQLSCELLFFLQEARAHERGVGSGVRGLRLLGGRGGHVRGYCRRGRELRGGRVFAAPLHPCLRRSSGIGLRDSGGNNCVCTRSAADLALGRWVR